MGFLGMFESTETCVNNLFKEAVDGHPNMACAVMDEYESWDATDDWYIAENKCGLFTTPTQICIPRDRLASVIHQGEVDASHQNRRGCF
ncbi:hypothetical protein DSO57_1010442 [Entomophthora muscae]|uniref:Uncharacterized protein n=1 Tax=Entomophthora muscae TaxID=34485 RepID=A0ACC2RXN2_9FUNG|nr:hypothetical protein DSO57_1010442 [Entomophthora muscae]